jgi:hypothetical protein
MECPPTRKRTGGSTPLPALQLRGSDSSVRRLLSTCIVIVEHHSITLKCMAAIFAVHSVSTARLPVIDSRRNCCIIAKYSSSWAQFVLVETVRCSGRRADGTPHCSWMEALLA